jgi:DNA-binding CsgD family transcriptional regulator
MARGARVAGNLPAELTSLVGRRGELAEVKRLLAGSRLVTLTGIGGVGKTRLALRAAAGLRRAFRDGVWLVQLDQLRDQALMTQAVAAALGLQDRAGNAPAATLADYLAGRQLLLVLDNCEHLLLAGFLAAVNGDRGAVQPLLEQGTSLARQLNEPATRALAAWVAGHVCLFAGDLPQAIAHSEHGLAVLPAGVRGRQRAHLLICLANAAGLAGDEERAAACHRELAALTEAGSEYIRGGYSAYTLWALGAAAWRRGDLDRATGLQQQSLRLRRDDQMGCAFCVEALAWIAASGRQYERAAVLLGTVTGLLQSMATTLDGNQHVAGNHRDCERQAREALGESAFWAAYNRGLGLSAGDAVAYALQQPPRKPRAPAVSDGAPLTPRELQVARLIAGGRSNKEIAADLVISQRTAENHVEHILTKLGFTSRAKVAAWVAASQPDGQGRLAAHGVQTPLVLAVPGQ